MRELRAKTVPAAGESSAERRRSHRVQITMPVLIRGKNGEVPFTEEAHTVSCLLYTSFIAEACGQSPRLGPKARVKSVSRVRSSIG